MSDVKVEIQNGKGKKKIWDILFALILFAFPFLHINTGLDIADTTYNLLNFASFPHMNQTWAVSTVLANLIGHGFSLLPFGNTMLGMNIYCTILGSVFILAFYCFLRKKYPALPVFLGLLIAEGFCWCPRVILYHYLSYFLFCIGALLLLAGIRKNKIIYYLLAGGVLALNVFVRFPNIVEASLIIVLFYYGISQKKNIVRAFLCCVGGYLLIALVGVLLVSLAFERTAYPDMIHSLFGMTKEATSYTPKSMLNTIFGDYLRYIVYLLPFLLTAVLGGVSFTLFKKKAIRIITVILMLLCFGFIMAVEYRKYGAFNLSYNDYRSIFMWGTFFLMIALFLGIYRLFDHKADLYRRLFGATVVLLILITPIGSNNGLYTAFNNMFLVAPFVIGELWEALAKAKEKGFALSFSGTLAFLCAVTLIQGVLFQCTFLFGGGSFINDRFVYISDNSRATNMRMDEKAAVSLQELNNYIKENALENRTAICYDRIPGLYYILDLPCVLSHSWAGLDSFPKEELLVDLQNLTGSENLPMFIYESRFGNLLTKNSFETGEEKLEMLSGFLKDNSYKEVFRNKDYVICLPEDSSDLPRIARITHITPRHNIGI